MRHYVDVCALEDIPNGKHRAFLIEGLSILILRVDTQAHALENRCTHLDFPLEGGRQIGSNIICRKHGARFDIRTGKAVAGPAVDPLRRFEVRLHDGRIEVEVGKPISHSPFFKSAN
ncbi:non-heme iron oxygenase ferredoxin subunit [Sphingobium sp.]|uniref:Rieske (2Fe-2S) protein n=1 Tax=Sphingobium sp. TaxID=1912891 RepID=UPI002CC838FC|nr:non-heme iron oxygenase ferredoxin subunit [Sphingobium sp.]HUD93608.1 non-heme iron oxygenase ferredoxin subunit [Sphingobium sp.]